MTNNEKIQILRDIYSVVYPNVSSLYQDNVGIELAYITSAVLEGQCCELDINSVLGQYLKAEFSSHHILWKFVKVELTVFCSSCHQDKHMSDSEYYVGINGWMCSDCKF